MDASVFTAFATVAVCLGGGMALVSVLPISRRSKHAAFAPLLVATMVLGTRYALFEDLGPRSDFTGNPAGQIIGVLLGVLAVWLVFFRDPRRREDRTRSQ